MNIFTNNEVVNFKADLVDEASLALGMSKIRHCHFLKDSGLLLVLQNKDGLKDQFHLLFLPKQDIFTGKVSK
jgi:hypothetical protein